jgi:uncharacterized phiE125 gp8 family phage protein
MYLSSYMPVLNINEALSYPYIRIAPQIFNVASLTRTVTTATAVTTAKHGYSNANIVTISGAVQTEYNGTFTIAVIDDYTFTFTIVGTPATPATGTIFVILTPQMPITIDMLKAHIRIDDPNAQVDYLNVLIQAVTRIAEDYCNVSFIRQAWRTSRDNFAQVAIELRKGSFYSLQAFKYLVDGVYIDVPITDYYVSLDAGYSQIRLRYNQEYPQNIDLRNNSVVIDFTAGLAADQANVPADLKLALLNHAAFAYENRGNNDIAGLSSRGAGEESGLNAIPNISQDVYNKYRIQDITAAYTYNRY